MVYAKSVVAKFKCGHTTTIKLKSENQTKLERVVKEQEEAMKQRDCLFCRVNAMESDNVDHKESG